MERFPFLVTFKLVYTMSNQHEQACLIVLCTCSYSYCIILPCFELTNQIAQYRLISIYTEGMVAMVFIKPRL